jgi:hypothetical protein
MPVAFQNEGWARVLLTAPDAKERWSAALVEAYRAAPTPGQELRAALHRQRTSAGPADMDEQLRLHGKLAYLTCSTGRLALGWRQSARNG